jgi:hypothetical protein
MVTRFDSQAIVEVRIEIIINQRRKIISVIPMKQKSG